MKRALANKPIVIGVVVGLALLGILVFGIRGRRPATIHAEVLPPDAGRVADTGKAPDASPSEAGSDASSAPPLSPACAALAKTNDATLQKLLKKQDAGADCSPAPPDVQCLTTHAGVTWGYRLEKATIYQDADSLPCTATYELRLVRQVKSAMQAMAGQDVSLTYSRYTKQKMIYLSELSDYDGDGEVEILKTMYEHETEGSPHSEVTVLTFQSGAVMPYPPTATLKIVDSVDIDDDGRIDFITRGPYDGVSGSDAFSNPWDIAGAVFAYHARTDGTFALDDDEAIAYARVHCPAMPDESSFLLHSAADMTRDGFGDALLCARLWGAAAAKIERNWDAVCRDFDAGDFSDTCQDWPKELARVTPPFTLR